MGALTQEALDARRTITEYYSFDKDLGIVQSNKSGQTAFPAIEGFLLGVATHEYDFKGKKQRKFDIFLQDNDNSKKLIQIQFGFNTWQTWIILNKFISVLNKVAIGEDFLISNTKGENGFFNIFLAVSGKQLKQKFTRKSNNDVLKLIDKDISGATEKNEARRDKLISGWYEALFASIPFDSYGYKMKVEDTPKDEHGAPFFTADDREDEINDDVPF